MVKRISTFSFTNEEKAFLKKIKHEASSIMADKAMEEGGEIDKTFSMSDDGSYGWSWRNFVYAPGSDITDREGNVLGDCHSWSGVIMKHDEISRRNAILSAYFSTKLFKKLEESGFTAEDIEKIADDKDIQEKLHGLIDEVFGDFRRTEAGEVTSNFVWRTWVMLKKHENDENGYWNELGSWAGFSKRHDNIENKPVYEKVTRLMGYYKSAFRVKRIAFLERASAPKIITVNEYRLLSEFLYLIFGEVVGVTDKFEDDMGWTLDGEWIGTKKEREPEEDDGLPPLGEDQPMYDENGNVIIYEWNKEEEKWENVGIMPAEG